ncbi:PepSY domain-containing protein [Mucilaginibacter sp.]|uniref:PepSY domain-containing protein n=1 Tax=Mucilaginibacter sp. TaxID=1882438 RepID=UPI0035BC5103
MTISVWRYSHLALAVSSFLLLSLAAITGIILAFQPVAEKLQPYSAKQFASVTLAQSLPVIRNTYPGISEITIDANHFVKVSGSDANGKKLLAYIDPLTGKKLGVPGNKSYFFEWVTALHRSLFLHETGRFFIGLTAFLLMLTTISGTILIIQRQRGLKRFFTKIARDNFAQYYHVVLGRWSLVPILIIAVTGTFLSLARFGLFSTPKASPKIDIDAIRSAPERKLTDIAIFKQTKLSDVESIEFPFSEDVEDYYTIKLKTGELAVNQITGDILGEVKYPMAVMVTNLSLDLHTGRGSAIWAIILAIASANILFFIFSGFAITLKRRANRTKNKFKAAECKFIILVGSENGNTFGFARAVHKQLLRAGEKSYIGELNSYTTYPQVEHLLIFAATYGLGDAPTNANRFASMLAKKPQNHTLKYSVVCFGSHSYSDFCKFGFETAQLLTHQTWATALIDTHTINDRSPDEFALWAEAWSQQSGIALTGINEQIKIPVKDLESFTVAGIVLANHENGIFSLKLQPDKKLRAKSGDLLAIYPMNDHRERLYSIGIIEKKLALSVRLHSNGIGSGFLHGLTVGQKISARVVDNTHFHFPANAQEVVMICNGTGIAPFLGMINQNDSTVAVELYCGFRDRHSYHKYEQFLADNTAQGKLSAINVAFSREGDKQYVYHLISRDADKIGRMLAGGGTVMICGSLAMQKDVMELLETICKDKTGKDLSYYQSHGQIRTDCY